MAIFMDPWEEIKWNAPRVQKREEFDCWSHSAFSFSGALIESAAVIIDWATSEKGKKNFPRSQLKTHQPITITYFPN